jgi:CheY-like chemotaxis protein
VPGERNSSILLIHDDPTLLHSLTEVLEGAGFDVAIAATAFAATNQLEERGPGEEFQAVVAGWGAGGRSGLRVYCWALEHRHHLRNRFVFLADEEPLGFKTLVKERCPLLKPVDTQGILQAVHIVMGIVPDAEPDKAKKTSSPSIAPAPSRPPPQSSSPAPMGPPMPIAAPTAPTKKRDSKRSTAAMRDPRRESFSPPPMREVIKRAPSAPPIAATPPPSPSTPPPTPMAPPLPTGPSMPIAAPGMPIAAPGMPIAAPMPPSTPAAASTPPPMPGLNGGKQMTMLLVEDDVLLLNYMRKRFMSAGFAVTSADSGSEAIQLLGGQDYDVVLADWYMPNGSGEELYAWVQLRRPEIRGRCFFMSGAVGAERHPDISPDGCQVFAKGQDPEPMIQALIATARETQSRREKR